MNSKKVLRFIYIILMFFLFIQKADAKRVSEDYFKPHSECINDGSCVLVCAYEGKVLYHDNSRESYVDVYIYHYPDSDQWQITMEDVEKNDTYRETEKGYAGDLFDGKHDVVAKDLSVFSDLYNNGICPRQVSLDTNTVIFHARKSICFGSAIDCQGFGSFIHFRGLESIQESNSILVYDLMAKIIDYFDNASIQFGNIDLNMVNFDNPSNDDRNNLNLLCEDLSEESSNSINIIESYKIMNEEMINELVINLLNNKSTDISTSAIGRWEGYQSAVDGYRTKIDNLYEKVKTYCLNYVENLDVSEEEKNEMQNNISSNVDNNLSDMVELVDGTISDINTGRWDTFNSNLWTCEYYIGNAAVKGTPAYFIDLVYDFIKITVAVLLFVLSIIDVFNAMVNSNTIQNVQSIYKKIIYRILVVIVLLLLPTMITLLGRLLIGKDILCGIG